MKAWLFYLGVINAGGNLSKKAQKGYKWGKML